MVTEKEIQQAFDDLTHSNTQLALAVAKETDQRTTIEARRAELLMTGEIDGKNAEIREAQLIDKLARRYNDHLEAQKEAAHWRSVLALNQIEVDRLKTLLRLMEVLKP
jgi:hypothetical protein